MAVDINQIDTALSAHAEWKFKLNNAIEQGISEYSVDNVMKDNVCVFGKWIYGLPLSVMETAEAQKVKELHAEFHKVAAETLRMAVSGKKDEARKSIDLGGPFNRASGRLVLALSAWKKELQ